MQSPHNDWWSPSRPLPLGGHQPDVTLLQIMENLAPPSRLAESVTQSIRRLETGRLFEDKSSISLQEKLRPLFCPMEINFESDPFSNNSQQSTITIPAGFFINPLLLQKNLRSLIISRDDYQAALTKHQSHFPETKLQDADHAWLTPVKAASDLAAIRHLISINLIDEKFAADILSIDMPNPVFSTTRCELLKFIPTAWSSDWRERFKNNLSAAHTPEANELLAHLNDATHTLSYHQLNAENYLTRCRNKLANPNFVDQLFLLLAQRRLEIKASEISKNPRGQILEPGFRVIFPEIANPPAPEYLTLTSNCDVL